MPTSKLRRGDRNVDYRGDTDYAGPITQQAYANFLQQMALGLSAVAGRDTQKATAVISVLP